MDRVQTYEEMDDVNQSNAIIRVNSFEAQKIEIIGHIKKAYKLLEEKRSELADIKLEAYYYDGMCDKETEYILKEDIRDIKRYIAELESEISEIDMLISCRDEEDEKCN